MNGIRIDRLKGKLGTRALPTAELVLDGCLAKRIGKEGQGVKIMSSLFNITRIYNSVIAVAYMRRALAMARDYAQRRMAFGKSLIDLPLHAQTLAQLEVRFRGSFALAFSLCDLLGKVECGQATEEENALLRLLTPVAKLFTAKEAVSVVSEALECMGGAGYIENTDMPRLLRDTQVLTIWEGTTNVLSLDMLRAFEKEKAFPVFLQFVDRKLKEFDRIGYSDKILKIDRSRKDLISFLASSHHHRDTAQLMTVGRPIGGIRGTELVNKMIQTRMLDQHLQSSFDFSIEKEGGDEVYGMHALLGEYFGLTTHEEFQGGEPNPFGILLWYQVTTSFAKSLAAACDTPTSPNVATKSGMLTLHENFAMKLKAACAWPADEALRRATAQALFRGIMGRGAQEEEDAFVAVFAGTDATFNAMEPKDRVEAIITAIMLNPHFP